MMPEKSALMAISAWYRLWGNQGSAEKQKGLAIIHLKVSLFSSGDET